MFASFNSPNETTLISTLTSTGAPLREKKKSMTVKTNKSKKWKINERGFYNLRPIMNTWQGKYYVKNKQTNN